MIVTTPRAAVRFERERRAVVQSRKRRKNKTGEESSSPVEMSKASSGASLLHFGGRLLARFLVLIKRQVAVVDLEGQERQRGLHDAAAVGAEGVTGGVPAAVLVLASDEDVAHAVVSLVALVPEVPVVAAHVMEDLRGVILIVDVLVGRGRILLQLLDAIAQIRVAARNAKILPAQQANG